MSRFKFGRYGDGFPMYYPTSIKREIRRRNRVVTSFTGLRQMEIELGPKLTLRTPRGLKVVAQRRAANKIARKSRRRNHG